MRILESNYVISICNFASQADALGVGYGAILINPAKKRFIWKSHRRAIQHFIKGCKVHNNSPYYFSA
jgi:hypothetical protein